MDQKPNLHFPVKQFASVSDAGDCPRADVAVDASGTAAAGGGKPGKLIRCFIPVIVLDASSTVCSSYMVSLHERNLTVGVLTRFLATDQFYKWLRVKISTA